MVLSQGNFKIRCISRPRAKRQTHHISGSARLRSGIGHGAIQQSMAGLPLPATQWATSHLTVMNLSSAKRFAFTADRRV
jgi:hypothetical protein